MMLAADTYVRWKAMQGQKLKLAMAVEGDLKEVGDSSFKIFFPVTSC